MDEQKVKEVFSDEAFVKELVELDTPEEVQARLKEKGVDVSVEEIEQIAKALQSQAEGELDEDALEDVAGGIIFTTLVLSSIGIAAAITGTVKSGKGRRW